MKQFTRLFLSCAILSMAALAASQATAGEKDTAKPNILWLTCEDIGPHLGCYGDRYAQTPHLDRLAGKGTVYLHAWSNAPVCAPARTTIITGVYPPSTGSQHMRSQTIMPEFMKMYPQFLREAGYYCTNNSKTDYNLQAPKNVWDESSGRAHWKNREDGQPFFAIFNFTNTHESRIGRNRQKLVHDPAKAPLPQYHPDHPEVRKDWAQYYDTITTMDGLVAGKLKELEQAGLADDTIVFFYGDHGSGMPRGKRCAYNSGLGVPMIVYVPEKFRQLASQDYGAGMKSERLVSFVDLAPTLLSLAGIKPPEWMQGHAFLGQYEAPPQPYLFGFRGRMDERYDMVRSVTDGRYVYVRNYMPHFPAGQFVDYMFKTPTTRVWKELFDQGKLTPEQARFWQPRASEELFDLKNDPDEVHNLADSPEHQKILKQMRQALKDQLLRIRDVGFLPEAEIHQRADGDAPYDMGHDADRYPLERIMATADMATTRSRKAVPELKEALCDKDGAVRYWGAMGFLLLGEEVVVGPRAHRIERDGRILLRGEKAVVAAGDELRKMLADRCVSARIAAAWALAKHGSDDDLKKALPVLLDLASFEKNGIFVALQALTAIDDLDDKAAGAVDQIKALPTNIPKEERRRGYGLPPLVRKILADLGK